MKILPLFTLLLLPLLLLSQSLEVAPETRLTGKGAQFEPLMRITVLPDGNSGELRKVRLNFSPDFSSVTEVAVFATNTPSHFDSRKVDDYEKIYAQLIDEQFVDCLLSLPVASDTLYLWVTAHVSPSAPEGAQVHCALQSYATSSGDFLLPATTPQTCREVVLSRKVLYRPGDYNSLRYRIPALITADDGTLVAATDKRKFSNNDLPADIDILCNLSDDNGKTWSAPITIVKGDSLHGYGDCALVQGNGKNELIAAFVGGVGLWHSTPDKPMHSYIARSTDNGQTWSEPVDITDFIFGSNCQDSLRRTWLSSFFASGNGLRTSTGRLMFVVAVRETSAYSLNNYVVYSDDNGETWQLSQCAAVGGDESKVVELEDGTILMSIRYANHRRYNLSTDGGITWKPTLSVWNDLEAPACNGDIIRYTSKKKGDDKSRLLHSLPAGDKREQVTVFLSYDEGATWPVKRCVVPCNAAYSSMCILPDGTVGLYVEETAEKSDVYEMVFYNFSLKWLTQGADDFSR